jgi:hypothetical protein
VHDYIIPVVAVIAGIFALEVLPDLSRRIAYPILAFIMVALGIYLWLR